MQNYFRLAHIHKSQWVDFLIANIHPQHVEEAKSYRKLPYPLFVAQLKQTFKEPDMEQAMTHELMQIQQAGDETITEFMAKVQATTDKAFRKHTEEVKERIAVAKFCPGLTD